MKKLIWIIILTLAALVSYGQSLSMQSTNAGLSIALGGGHYSWESDGFGAHQEIGRVVNFNVAYGLNENIEVLAGLKTAFVTPEDPAFLRFAMNHFEFGGRYTFGSTMRKTRGHVGLTAFKLSSEQEYQDDWLGLNSILNLSGFGATISGGCKYHLSLPIAVTVDAAFSSGKFSLADSSDQQPEFDYSSFQISVGVVMYINQL